MVWRVVASGEGWTGFGPNANVDAEPFAAATRAVN
jgi:hypothetical protein